MDEMQVLTQAFLTESSEILEALDQKFVELEKNPCDFNLLNDIFRSVHTVKGAAGFLGHKQLVEVVHATESLLNKLRQGELKVDARVIDIILEATDTMKLLVKHIANNNKKEEEDISVVIGKINEVLLREESEIVARPAQAIANDIIQPGQEQFPDEMIMMQAEQTIRVDTKRLDDVLDLVGELVLERNRLIKLSSVIEGKERELAPALNEIAAHMNLITTGLQLAVMKTRMQPVGKTFSRLPRLVRDLSILNGKEINLQVTGEGTEVDKSVVDEIGDPLVHLIRNSVDHGIETPEERTKKGKPRKGTIKLDAYQEGEHIVIVVSDDGKGMDPAAIRGIAIKNNLVSDADAARIDDKEILNFIFLPGFSTASTVTDISGRGVGMDVVKTNIAKLSGVIEIDSKVDIGTKFSLKFPLTVAIMQTLMAGVGNEIFAIPLSNIVEAVEVTPSEIHQIEGSEVISLRNTVLPVIRLSKFFGIPVNPGERNYVVVIAGRERNFGILVGRLIGQEEVVIKPLDNFARSAEEVAGATITGDGKVVLVLDVAKMIGKLTNERILKK